MKSRYFVVIVMLASFFTLDVQGQRLAKGFKALGEKNFFKSKRIFEKSMYGYPSTAAYGLSLMYYEQKNPFYSLDSALKYVVYADSALTMADKKELKMVQRFAITKEVFAKHKAKISTRAYESLAKETTIDQYDVYLKKYPYGEEYIKVVDRRDSLGFFAATQANTFDAYREFIISYPGSKYRSKADSLYAKSFFYKEIGNGDIKAYKQFVKDFPASPYIDDAYDQIFSNVRALDTKEAYNEFIEEYPENIYSELAWKNLIGLSLRENYSEKSIAKILADYPLNPHAKDVEAELKGYFISYFPVEIEGKWGFVRGDGELTIPATYEAAYDFHEGLAAVKKRGKYGFIDKRGQVIITTEYDEVSNFINGVVVVEKEGKMGLIDRRNKRVLPNEFDDIGELSDNRILAEKNGVVNYYHAGGELVIDSSYVNGMDFKNGHAVVKLNEFYGLINVENKVVIPFEYDWVENTGEDRLRVKQGGSFGLMSVTGEVLLPLEYDWISPLEEDNPILLEKDGKFGYLNSQNEVFVPVTYDLNDEAGSEFTFVGNFAKIKKGNKYGVIDIFGKIVMPIEYNELGMPSENFVSYRLKNKWGYREMVDSKRIIEPEYDEAFPFERGLAIVRIGDKYGAIDPNGQVLLAVDYSSVESEKSIGLLIVEKNGLKGLMDRDKNLILGFKYKEIQIANYRYARAVNDEGVSFYDLQKNKFIWQGK